MKEVTNEILNKDDYLIYIETPFCGTCHVAKAMLKQIEAAHDKEIFYQMNASLYPALMQELRIESVPCLLIKSGNSMKEKVYTFHSVPHIYTYLIKYQPELFSDLT